MTLSEWNALVVETLKDGCAHNFEIMAEGDEIQLAWIDAEQIHPGGKLENRIKKLERQLATLYAQRVAP